MVHTIAALRREMSAAKDEAQVEVAWYEDDYQGTQDELTQANDTIEKMKAVDLRVQEVRSKERAVLQHGEAEYDIATKTLRNQDKQIHELTSHNRNLLLQATSTQTMIGFLALYQDRARLPLFKGNSKSTGSQLQIVIIHPGLL